MGFSFHSPIDTFFLKCSKLFNWGLLRAQEKGPKRLDYFIICELGRLLNYDEKFGKTIKRNPLKDALNWQFWYALKKTLLSNVCWAWSISCNQIITCRNSLSQIFFKIGVLKVCNFIKKRLQHRCFLMNIAKILKTALLIEDLWWLQVFCCTKSFNLYMLKNSTILVSLVSALQSLSSIILL